MNIGTGTGGTVTLDQTASVYNLNMEAGSSSGYTLAFNPSETLTTAGTVNLGTGAEIDVENSGAKLTAGGDFTNAGTLHLENGGIVAVGTTAEPGISIIPARFSSTPLQAAAARSTSAER